MRSLAVAALVLFSVGCKPAGAPPAPPAPVALRPEVVVVSGTIHAVKCGAVTAAFVGDVTDKKEFGVKQLFFLINGEKLEAHSEAALEFSDHFFDVFSPDCSHVALLQSHSGPIHLINVSELAGTLKGTSKPQVISAPSDSGTAGVVDHLTWTGPGTFEFASSCCGGAEVFKAPSLERVAFISSAPNGIRRTTDGKWEAVP